MLILIPCETFETHSHYLSLKKKSGFLIRALDSL